MQADREAASVCRALTWGWETDISLFNIWRNDFRWLQKFGVPKYKWGRFKLRVLTRSSIMSGCGGPSNRLTVWRMSWMWLLRWRTGFAMTVLVGAMQAERRGSVVGRGRGDCSCFTVVSYRVRQERVDLILQTRNSFAWMWCVCTDIYQSACVPAGSPAEGTEAPCELKWLLLPWLHGGCSRTETPWAGPGSSSATPYASQSAAAWPEDGVAPSGDARRPRPPSAPWPRLICPLRLCALPTAPPLFLPPFPPPLC